MTEPADALRCPAHPEADAVAACVECGRWVCGDCFRIGDDGLARCAECAAPVEAASCPPVPLPAPVDAPAPEPAAPVVEVIGPSPVPWEQPTRHRDLPAFALTVREALLGPTRYMARIPWLRGDLRTPLIFAVLAGVIGQIGLIASTQLAGPPAGMGGAVGGFAGLPLGGALSTLPLLPLMVSLSVFGGAWLAHTMLRLAGDPPRPFEATFRVYAYAEVSSLLLLVPWIGPYAARFYFVFLLLTGLRLAQGAGFSASLLAMAPSVVLMWVLV